MFFTQKFDWIMAAIFAVCAIVFLLGKGEGIMSLFGGSQQQYTMKVQKKRTKEEELLYQRAIGVYCLLLTANEVILALWGSTSRIVPIITILICVGGLAGLVMFLKKRF